MLMCPDLLFIFCKAFRHYFCQSFVVAMLQIKMQRIDRIVFFVIVDRHIVNDCTFDAMI